MDRFILYPIVLGLTFIIFHQLQKIDSLKDEIKHINTTIDKLNEMNNKRIENELKSNNALSYLNQCKLKGYTNEADIFNNINNILFNDK